MTDQCRLMPVIPDDLTDHVRGAIRSSGLTVSRYFEVLLRTVEVRPVLVVGDEQEGEANHG